MPGFQISSRRCRNGIVAALAGVTFLLCLAGAASGSAAAPPGDAAFDSRIAPILARRCLECHNGSNRQGGLDLTRAETTLKGGNRGPSLVPGKPEGSLLWKRVAADEMPPKHPLPADEKRLLREWIAGGAKWGADPIDPFRATTDRRAGYDWWSLQPVRAPALPKVRQTAWAGNPVDRFILAKLEAKGLKPSPAADRVTLVRRLYFDLLGLPPTPAEVDAFVKDPAPGAYERLVDRLLDSPHYGERWARHWLDVVRFGESQGFERNKLRPNAWKYRDWVVEAFNRDLPYDEFVRLQLAGDVIRPDDPLAVIASGLLVMGPYDLTAYTDGTASMRAAAREEELEGLVGTVTQTFLGLTVNCARCHDHKFDPVAQKEYYQVAAALGGTYHGDERETLSAAGRPQAEKERAALAEQVAALKTRLAGSAGEEKPDLTAEISRLESRARLLSGGPAHLSVPKNPGVFHVLARGDFRQRGEAVKPSGIASLSGVPADWKLPADAPEGARRKALADWIAHPENPLTARVMVNRVWQGHFGAGLLPTPNDFGFNGGKPSHPELLDYLASVFSAPATSSGVDGETESRRDQENPDRRITPSLPHSVTPSTATGVAVRRLSAIAAPEGLGWSVKRLHRLILTSNAYKQASRPVPAGMKQDAENRLLWRQNPRRLEAEAVRDAVLRVSGDLDPKLGGPGFRDWTVKSQGNNEIYTIIDASGPEFNRRTLYRMVVRAGTHPLLDALDCPDPSVSAPRRTVTTTPLQALSLLNSAFMERSAARWAERLERDAGKERRAQVVLAYRLAFGRTPSEDEVRFGERFAADHGLDQLCLVLLNTNEFLYVD